MLSGEARERLVVVLVGARNPQNIGAAARAMQDFGFSRLRVVNEYTAPFEAARLEASSAVAAENVMQAAELYTSLHAAIADCAHIVGTTAIGGRTLHRSVQTLQEASPLLLARLERGAEGETARPQADLPRAAPNVALLFGSEKTGLTNEQLSFCSILLTIPLFAPAGRHLSMNLGQAVAVTLYELTRSGFDGSRPVPYPVANEPTMAVRERVLLLLQATMQATGYTRRFPANSRPEVLRQLVLQLGKTSREAETWLGFFRQILLGAANKDGEAN